MGRQFWQVCLGPQPRFHEFFFHVAGPQVGSKARGRSGFKQVYLVALDAVIVFQACGGTRIQQNLHSGQRAGEFHDGVGRHFQEFFVSRLDQNQDGSFLRSFGNAAIDFCIVQHVVVVVLVEIVVFVVPKVGDLGCGGSVEHNLIVLSHDAFSNTVLAVVFAAPHDIHLSLLLSLSARVSCLDTSLVVIFAVAVILAVAAATAAARVDWSWTDSARVGNVWWRRRHGLFVARYPALRSDAISAGSSASASTDGSRTTRGSDTRRRKGIRSV